jgi:protein O-GlcNAc transferase
LKAAWIERLAEFAVARQNSLVSLRGNMIQPQNPTQMMLVSGQRLQAEGRVSEAIALYRQVIALEPRNPNAHNFLGLALAGTGQVQSGLTHLKRANKAAPNNAGLLTNQGLIEFKLGQKHAAETSFRKAISADRKFGPAYFYLGDLLSGRGEYEQAYQHYDRALEANPTDLGLIYRKASLLERWNRLGEAEAVHRQAIECAPSQPNGYVSTANVLVRTGRADEAIALIERGLSTCDNKLPLLTSLLFLENYRGTRSSQEMLEIALRFGDEAARLIPAKSHQPEGMPSSRALKVGFVSGDFKDHPVARFLMGPLGKIDKSVCEIFAYSAGTIADDTTARLKTIFHHWRDIAALPDSAAADLIGKDGVDILIDLSGHTNQNRLTLFAMKPAPVQISWLGYSGTTGLQTMDYLFVDRHVVPDANEITETPWYVSSSYLCFVQPSLSADVAPLPALENGFVTFGSLNNLGKLSDTTLALWAGVLTAVPHSRMIIKAAALSDKDAQDGLLRRIAATGLDIERVELIGRVESEAEHLGVYSRIDVGLDPTPYNGTTTTVEALYMGVPVLSLEGDRFIARVGKSILSNVGLGDCAVQTPEAFVERAVRLASDLPALAELRTGLRAQLLASPLCDHQGFASDLQKSLHDIWERWSLSQAE